jgi:hypothetical protein
MPAPKRQPAFQFYPSAWLNSVSVETMPPEVEGTYIRLLSRQWVAGELPESPATLRLLTKLSPAQWKRAWPLLEPHFPIFEQGGRRNTTLAAVQEERETFKKDASESGRVGAEKRWGKRGKKEADPTPEQKHTPPKNDGVPVGYPMATPSQPQWGSGSSVSVSGTEPLSPSPSGEGSFPAAAPPLAVVASRPEHSETLLPGETLPEYRQRMRAPTETLSFADQMAALLADVEHEPARAAIGLFLVEQRILPDRLASWVRRIAGWTKGLGTSGMRAVSWEAVVLGIEELLDTNPPGQSIKAQQLLTFVESAHRRLSSPGMPGKRTGPDAERERETEHRKVLIEYAQQGDSHAIAECDRLGIDYRSVA